MRRRMTISFRLTLKIEVVIFISGEVVKLESDWVFPKLLWLQQGQFTGTKSGEVFSIFSVCLLNVLQEKLILILGVCVSLKDHHNIFLYSLVVNGFWFHYLHSWKRILIIWVIFISHLLWTCGGFVAELLWMWWTFLTLYIYICYQYCLLRNNFHNHTFSKIKCLILNGKTTLWFIITVIIQHFLQTMGKRNYKYFYW